MPYTYPVTKPSVYTVPQQVYSTNPAIRKMQEKQAAATAAAYAGLNQSSQNYYNNQIQGIDSQRQDAMGQVAAGGYALPQELQQYGSPQQITSYYNQQTTQKQQAEQKAKDDAAKKNYYTAKAYNSGVQLPPDVVALNDPAAYDAYIRQAVTQRETQKYYENLVGTRGAKAGAAGYDLPDSLLRYGNDFQVSQAIADRQRYYRQLGQSAGYGANVPGFLSQGYVGGGAATNYSARMDPYSISQRENERRQQEMDMQMKIAQLNELRGRSGGSVGGGGDDGAKAARIRSINNHYAELGRLGSAEHLRDLQEAGAAVSQYGYADR